MGDVPAPDITWHQAGACDRRMFRDMLGSFMTGVTVVAAEGGDGRVCAFTANSFTSVSLDPPLVLVCLAKSASSLEAFSVAAAFSINILSEGQREVSATFATRGEAKSAALQALARDGVPYVPGSLATMVCSRRQVIDAGDHVILLGAVQRFATSGGDPLGYFRGSHVSFGLAERQLQLMPPALRVGGLLEVDEQILLCRRPGAAIWDLPMIPATRGQTHSAALALLFERLGLKARSSFLYSLHQQPGEDLTTLVFRMETEDRHPVPGTGAPDLRFFGADDQPWRLVRGGMMQGMLHRFFRERAAGAPGMHCDTADGGRVSPLAPVPTHWTQWLAGLARSQMS
nr:flavin reductase [uncultured Gellertiella sp.]